MTNAEAWFNIALRPQKPEGSLGRTAQDGHLDSHTAPELCRRCGGDSVTLGIVSLLQHTMRSRSPPVCLQRQFGVKHILKPKQNKQTTAKRNKTINTKHADLKLEKQNNENWVTKVNTSSIMISA